MWSRDMAGRNHSGRTQHVLLLIVEEYVSAKGFQNGRLVSVPNKMRFICRSPPCSQGADHPFMGGSVSGCNESNTDFANVVLVEEYAAQL